VLAIALLAASLLLAAVLRAREAALRLACANNLRQIGFAVSGYESTSVRFPGPEAWTVAILEHVELGAVKRMPFESMAAYRANIFVCPSDGFRMLDGFASGNSQFNGFIIGSRLDGLLPKGLSNCAWA